MPILMFLPLAVWMMFDSDRFFYQQLFKVISAETGVSLTSPMEIEINGEKYYRNDTRTLQEASKISILVVIIDINEYDMVEVKILKNVGKPIPGNGRLDWMC